MPPAQTRTRDVPPNAGRPRSLRTTSRAKQTAASTAATPLGPKRPMAV